MSTLTSDLERTLENLDSETASRLERVVRDAMDLVSPVQPALGSPEDREAWLQQLDRLRATVGTGKQGTSTEEILEDLRAED